MKRVAILQPNYDDVQYTSRDWRNRSVHSVPGIPAREIRSSELDDL